MSYQHKIYFGLYVFNLSNLVVWYHEKNHASKQQTQVGCLVRVSSAQLHLDKSEKGSDKKCEIQGECNHHREWMEGKVCASLMMSQLQKDGSKTTPNIISAGVLRKQ